jgi:hypothetical protein
MKHLVFLLEEESAKAFIDYQNNTSHSFNVFLKGIKTLLEI